VGGMTTELTPAGYLYMVRLNQYKEKHKKEPDKHEKFEMYAKAEFDYKHASMHDKLIFERQVKEFNKTIQKGEKKK
jgi:hypothetical protein